MKRTQAPLTEVRFEGNLKTLYGPCYKLRGYTPRDLIKGLCVNLPGLAEHLNVENSRYILLSGDRILAEKDIDQGCGSILIISPAIEGSGNFARGIVGAGLLAAGVFTGSAPLIYGGASLLGGAVVSALSPKNPTPRTESERSQSFLFSSTSGTADGADAVAEAYGKILCPTRIVNEAISVSDI